MHLNSTDLITLSRLLDEAMDLEPARAEAWLAALPEEHAHLRPKLEEMLTANRADSDLGFMADGPKLAGPFDETVARADELIGPYRLIREIGKGGMGTVWLAKRADGTLKRHVALKLPRLAWGAGLAERMARERDIGALLEHPNIARLYDAGVDANGRPYLALEYIDGQPLDVWCETQALSVRDRLRLFVQVARAVAYAHGRLVVHRDLKPSNVLVTADGQAHLLDFGIAKLLTETAIGEPGLTQQQGRVLTPHYASPEQVAGDAITVASDIYSLGVLLYEVLTGTLPITPKRGTAAALEDAVLQGDAPSASGRVRDRGVAKALRGEVDLILSKAMQREPSHRYVTADALAQDIERHLNGETVAARPDSLMYRFSKVVRRHWVGVSAAAAVLVAVLSGSAVAVVQAQRAARSAEREQVVKEFVADVFRVNANVNAANAGVRPASSHRLLEDGAQLIEKRFAGQLALQAELYGIVGDLCSTLGDYRLAASYATRRVETLLPLHPDSTQQARAVLALAAALYDARRFADAEPRARRGLELAADNPSLQAEALMILGGIHANGGQRSEARSELDAAQAKLASVSDAPSITLAKVRARQGILLIKENRMDDAVQSYRQAVDLAVAAAGPLSPVAATIRIYLAQWLLNSGRNSEGTLERDRAFSALRSLGGAHAARAAYEAARLASLFPARDREGWYAQSVAAIESSRNELARTTAPIPEWFGPQIEFWLGALKSEAGDVAAGLPLMEANVDVLYKTLDAATDRFDQAERIGNALTVAGRHDLADRWLRELVELRGQIGEADHPWAVVDKSAVAANLRMAGKLGEAHLVLDSIPPTKTVRGEADPDSVNRRVLKERIRLLLAQGAAQGALQRLEQAALPPDPDPDGRADEVRLLGETLCAVGDERRGLELLMAQVSQDDERAPVPSAPWLARSRAVTGLCALSTGRGKDARQLATQARAAFTAQPGVSPYYKAPLFKLERALGLRLPTF